MFFVITTVSMIAVAALIIAIAAYQRVLDLEPIPELPTAEYPPHLNYNLSDVLKRIPPAELEGLAEYISDCHED